MKISSKSRYGLKAMVKLAFNHGQGLMKIKTIAEGEDVSVKYVENQIAILYVAGLVRSARGPKGGYVLARHPSEIKVSEVINALDGPTHDIKCTKHTKFTKGCNNCLARHIWSKIHGTIWDLLDSMTLQDLIDMKK
jgi:Rrf2 family cysteine metabolism transcriptional repressor